MVTGRRSFDGQSQASLIAAILDRDPPAMSTLQPTTPSSLERVTRKCLAKDPDARWQSAGDLLEELEWVADGTLGTIGPAPAGEPRKQRAVTVWASVSTILLMDSQLLEAADLRSRAVAEWQCGVVPGRASSGVRVAAGGQSRHL